MLDCAAAVVFMHAYRYPAHERRQRHCARSRSTDQHLAPDQPDDEAEEPGDTTVADAHLSPRCRYVGLRWRPRCPVKLPFRTGGLTDAAHAFAGKDAILPAPPVALSAWRAPPRSPVMPR
jgi:5-oxoprolinase (ATP-hydrolysing)